MNIDERIQALTESVELLASFHRDTDARLEKLLGIAEKLMTAVGTMSQLVIQHEQRIQRLEGNQ